MLHAYGDASSPAAEMLFIPPPEDLTNLSKSLSEASSMKVLPKESNASVRKRLS